MWKFARRLTNSTPWTLFVGVSAVLWTTTCSSSENSAENPGTSEEGEMAVSRIVNVEVTPAATSDFTDYIRIVGEVEAWQDVTVGAEENGVIERFFLGKGTSVRQGQPIAKLKDDILTAQVEEARAVADLAREQYERQQELWQKDKVGSELAYLQAKSQAAATAARLNMLQARLSNTTVRAPIGGIFEDQYLEVGEMAAVGSPLVRIVRTDKVKITGGVPERFALSIHPGDSAQITFDILSHQQFVGRIDYVGSTVNPDSRTFPIEIVLDNPHHEIKPSMVANLRLVRVRLKEVIIVPRQVVQRMEDGYVVYVAQENRGEHFASTRPVHLGPAHGNQLVVDKGLSVGDLIITVGYQQVDEGSPIRLVNLGTGAAGGKND